MAIWASGNKITPAKLNINQAYGVSAQATTSGSDATTSATYVNMAGPGSFTSFSFTKLNAATRIEVDIRAGFYGSLTGSGVQFGVKIGSTDYDVCKMGATLPAALAHLITTGVTYISGIAVGTYTIQGRWKRIGGSSTMSRDVGDWLSITAKEVA